MTTGLAAASMWTVNSSPPTARSATGSQVLRGLSAFTALPSGR